MKKKKGFTLLEILMTVVLSSIIITASSSIFSSAIRSDEKARAILEVKQVGDNALNLIANKIRDARGVTTDIDHPCDVSPSGSSSITIEDSEGGFSTFTCLSDGIRAGSAEDGVYLTSSDMGISDHGSCFTCYEDPAGGPEYVEIRFILRKEHDNPLQSYELDFSTAVSLRNY